MHFNIILNITYKGQNPSLCRDTASCEGTRVRVRSTTLLQFPTPSDTLEPVLYPGLISDEPPFSQEGEKKVRHVIVVTVDGNQYILDCFQPAFLIVHPWTLPPPPPHTPLHPPPPFLTPTCCLPTGVESQYRVAK